MSKNYYDILEINKNASQEIVEKAYKTLAKKYHPDLQDESSKKDSELKMKELNEAYEVISNPEKRALYNIELEQLEKEKDSLEYESQVQKQASMQSQTDEFYQQQLLKKEQEYAEQQSIKQAQYEQEMQYAINKAYHDAYIQDLKNRGYKIRYKKSLKDYIRMIFSFFLIIFVLFLIIQIPSVKNFFTNLYQENQIIHTIVDIITQFFENIY